MEVIQKSHDLSRPVRILSHITKPGHVTVSTSDEVELISSYRSVLCCVQLVRLKHRPLTNCFKFGNVNQRVTDSHQLD